MTRAPAQCTAAVDGDDGWGLLVADAVQGQEMLGLLGSGERRFVVISTQRDATAYLRLGAFLAGRAPGRSV